MSKIHLVLVDKEKDYLEAVTNYILSNHSNRFKVSSFSKMSYFKEFMGQNHKTIDVLLIDESMYDVSLNNNGIGTVLQLYSVMTKEKNDDLHMVYKYQSGNEIIKDIIKALSQDYDNEVCIHPYGKKTKFVAVYSPKGGVGKTSTAVVGSILCSNMGGKILYLNFESYQSTPLFFDCNEEENLSEVFYHVKNRSKNLSLKIEGVISVDSQSKVNYFSPPESIIDINEFTEEEVNIFLKEIKHINKYDYVFVDMSSSLDMKNISILSKSDQIILVITPDVLSILKTRLFLKDLDILSKRLEDNIIDRVSIIINKYNPEILLDTEDLGFNCEQIHAKIPKVLRIFSLKEGVYRVDLESQFTTSLRDYINHFIRR